MDTCAIGTFAAERNYHLPSLVKFCNTHKHTHIHRQQEDAIQGGGKRWWTTEVSANRSANTAGALLDARVIETFIGTVLGAGALAEGQKAELVVFFSLFLSVPIACSLKPETC